MDSGRLPPQKSYPSGNHESSPARRLVQIRKILRFASQRGFARFDDLDANAGQLSTTGILLERRGKRNARRAFATLTDGRDKIQLVFTSGRTGVSTELLDRIQRGGRVVVTGVPFMGGRDKNAPTPSLFVTDLHTYSSPPPVTFDETGLTQEVAPRLVIGRLMSLLSEELEDEGHVRYEQRFITNSQVDLDMGPLMVRFPGRGADLYLEVSPLPQLLFAAIMTGETKLYAPTRLFSRAHRDGAGSADSPIIAAVEVERGSSRKSRLEDVIQNLLSVFNKAEQRGLPFEPVPDENIVFVDGMESPASSDSVTIRFGDVSPPATSEYAYDIRRRVEVDAPRGRVLIEGHEGKIAQSISYNWVCVHVERLAFGDFWRIGQRRALES